MGWWFTTSHQRDTPIAKARPRVDRQQAVMAGGANAVGVNNDVGEGVSSSVVIDPSAVGGGGGAAAERFLTSFDSRVLRTFSLRRTIRWNAKNTYHMIQYAVPIRGV